MSTLLPALALSVGAYLLGVFVYRAAQGSPLLHPVVIATFAAVLMLVALNAVGLPFAGSYLEENAILIEGLMLGITAFALPLIENARQLVRDLVGIFAVTAISGVLIGATTLLIAFVFGLPPEAIAATGLRTVTNPMAAVIAEANDLSIEIAMLGVFVTGGVGIAISEKLLSLIGVTDARRVGLILGIICHTFGVVRALEISPLAAAYATVGMIVTGLLYAFTVPWVLLLVG
jgi:putative effector of murein hydrolase